MATWCCGMARRFSVLQTPDGPVPRFPLLEILKPGDEHRLRFVALQDKPGRIDELEAALPEYAKLFVHREKVEVAAPRRADGSAPRSGVTPGGGEDRRLVYGKIILSRGADLRGFRASFEKATAKGIAIALPGLYEALGETKRAGQEHQAWRGVERKAKKRGLLG